MPFPIDVDVHERADLTELRDDDLSSGAVLFDERRRLRGFPARERDGRIVIEPVGALTPTARESACAA